MNRTRAPARLPQDAVPPVPWLWRDLTLRLMLPLLAIVLATAALGACSARRLTGRVFDRWLFDAAQSVGSLLRFDAAGRARIELPPSAERLLLYDEVDRTSFSVSQDGRLLAGAPGIPSAPGAPDGRGRQAYDASFDGRPVRVAQLLLDDGHGHHAEVRLAETLSKRERATHVLDLVLWPMAALLLAAAGAIVLAVRRSVVPLQRIAARWNERSHHSLAPICDDDLPGELAPFALALNDLLARIRAILARERQFAAAAAHQLRTPLAGLQLGLARAAAQPDLASARAVMQELGAQTQRTARLLQQLLAWGRLDPERRGDLDVQRSDLVALAREVGAAYAPLALAAGIELELAAPAAPVAARLQPELVAEALGNLIDNAIRYTPRGGRVQVQVGATPPVLAVADSGPGIDDDEREAVLERFRRGRHARGDGSGLGLTIVREIAALHDARLQIGRSRWGGACISLCFGADAPAAERVASTPVAAPRAQTAPASVPAAAVGEPGLGARAAAHASTPSR